MSTQLRGACALFAALLLAGCGGGAPNQNACALGSSVGCGGTLQSSGTTTTPPVIIPTGPIPDTAASAAAVDLVFSSTELASAGLPGTEVEVSALVKTAQNTALAGANVSFSADSGFLVVGNAITDKWGKASANLGTGGATANRPIKVSVKVGSQTASAVVNVVGTTLTLAGPGIALAGTAADITATLRDSASRPISGALVAVKTANGNAVSGAAAATNAQGQVALRLQASQRGSELVTVSASGATASKGLSVEGNDVNVSPPIALDASGNEVLKEVMIGTCSPIGGRYEKAGAAQAGFVTMTASRGQLFADAACTAPLTGSRALVNGNFPAAYILSDTTSVATVNALLADGASASTRLEFVARVTPQASINLQAGDAVIGSGEKSTLVAVVRDGTPANNLVKGATVEFSIVADASGGNLMSPFSSVTGSDGAARAVFVAGPGDTSGNGAVIEARIAGVPAASSSTRLTVSKKALSIQFGTGNTLVEFSPAVLQHNFAVFVADAAGNAVPDVSIGVAAWPTQYAKGRYTWVPDLAPAGNAPLVLDPGIYVPQTNFVCNNEDVQRKGLYEPGYDLNGNGVLDPGIPLSVGVTAQTDALGMATVSLRYPRDRANWVRLELMVTGRVAGTESVARTAFWLKALVKDLSSRHIAPPGNISPYGEQACGSRN